MLNDFDNFFAEQVAGITGLDQHSTVSNGKDNGANNCLAGAFHNAMRHGTTRKAVDNLKSRLAGKPATINICGHGSPGMFETGAGQNGWHWDKIVSDWYIDPWKTIFSELNGKNFPILNIYSCSTGAGNSGADLLWEMAKTIGKPVRARTGLTYCGGNRITFQPGSTWQTAHPSARPTPIPETPHKIFFMKPNTIYLSDSEMNISQVKANNIVSLKVIALGKLNQEILLDGSSATEVGALILNESLQPLPGSVLGFATMELHFTIQSEKDQKKIKLLVFNDSIAVNEKEGIMYALPRSFRMLIGI